MLLDRSETAQVLHALREVTSAAGQRTTNSSETAGRMRRLAPGGTTALQYSRKGGRLVPASTDSLLSVTLVSLRMHAAFRQLLFWEASKLF